MINDPVSGMKSVDEMGDILRGTFARLGYGAFDIKVDQSRYYDARKGWTSDQGEYAVHITHPQLKDEPWTGVLKGGPNNTIMLRSGEGWQMVIGDLDVVTPERGIATGQTSVKPFYTGIESFARRMTAAFGILADDRRENGGSKPLPGEFMRPQNVDEALYQVNALNKQGSGYAGPGGEPVPGAVPLTQVRVEPHESPGNVRFKSFLYNVPIIGDVGQAVEKLHQQVREFGTSTSSPWARLHGGGAWRPDQNERGLAVPTGQALFKTRAASGTEYTDEYGNIQVAGLTQTDIKHTYVAERRPVATPIIATGSRMFEVPRSLQAQTSMTLRPDVAPHMGIRTQAITSLTPLPWQSGQMQVSLPRPLKQYTAENNGLLMAGTRSRQTFEIEGALGLSDLAGRLSVNAGLLNRQLESGRSYTFGGFLGDSERTGYDALKPGQVLAQVPEGYMRPPNRAMGERRATPFSGVDVFDEGSVPKGAKVTMTYQEQQDAFASKYTSPLAFTTSQQNQAVTGYSLNVPASWLENKEEIQPLLDQLTRSGITEVRPSDSVSLQVDLMTATAAGFKGGGAKGQGNIPLIGDVPRTLRGDRLPYDVLQEAKQVDAITWNAIQAMPKSGDNNVFDFFKTIFPEASKQISRYQRTAGEGYTLQGLSSALKYKTPEHLLYAATNRTFGFSGQLDAEGNPIPVPYDQLDQERNQQLIKQFGMGRVRSTVAVEQYTPQSRRELRSTFVQQEMARGATTREAMRGWGQLNKNMRFDRDTGLYTMYADIEGLYHPKLMTTVLEYAGVGSDQGGVGRAIKGQGFDELSDWYQQNRANLYRDTPAKEALNNIQSSHSATLQSAPVGPNMVTIGGPGGLSPRSIKDQYLSLLAEQGAPTRLHNLRLMSQAVQRVAGQTFVADEEGNQVPLWKEGDPDLNYFFATSKTGFAGGKYWEALESAHKRVTNEGLDVAPTAQVATRAYRAMLGLLETEETGKDPSKIREEAQDLQQKYIFSEQIRKNQGGIFSRYAGSGLLSSNEIFLTEQGMRRAYMVGGGNEFNEKEYRAYQKLMEGATAVWARPPYVNMGTEGMPGSYAFAKVITPEGGRTIGAGGQRLGQMLSGAIEASGIATPDLVVSQMYSAGLGDLDLDPASMLPMVAKNDQGRWKRFNPKREKYEDWMARMSKAMGPEAQENTYNAIFGALAPQMSPFSEQLHKYVSSMMPGADTKSLLNKRLSLEVNKTQELVSAYNEQKGRRMGSTYNTYIRRLQSAATVLGVPDALASRMSDVNSQYYQYAVDQAAKPTFFEMVMQTSGFFAQGNQGPGGSSGVTWGLLMGNADDPGKPSFTMGQHWNPTQTDMQSTLIPRLVMSAAVQSGSTEHADRPTPEGIASMFLNVPEWGPEVSEEERTKYLRERRDIASQRLGKAMSIDDLALRSTQVEKVANQLTDEGILGWRSTGGISVLSRGMEYLEKLGRSEDPAKKESYRAITAQLDKTGALIGGKRYDVSGLRNLVRPARTMYQFMKAKHATPEDSDLYTDPFNLARLYVDARQGGFAGAAWIQQIHESYGEAAGLPNPLNAEAQLADPVTGETKMLSSHEDVLQLRKDYEGFVAAQSQPAGKPVLSTEGRAEYEAAMQAYRNDPTGDLPKPNEAWYSEAARQSRNTPIIRSPQDKLPPPAPPVAQPGGGGSSGQEPPANPPVAAAGASGPPDDPFRNFAKAFFDMFEERFGGGRTGSGAAGMDTEELIRAIQSSTNLDAGIIAKVASEMETTRFFGGSQPMSKESATGAFAIARQMSRRLGKVSGDEEDIAMSFEPGEVAGQMEALKQEIVNMFPESSRGELATIAANQPVTNLLGAAIRKGESEGVPVGGLLKQNKLWKTIERTMKPLVGISGMLAKRGIGSIEREAGDNEFGLDIRTIQAISGEIAPGGYSDNATDAVRQLAANYGNVATTLSKTPAIAAKAMPMTGDRRQALDEWVEENQKAIKTYQSQTEAIRRTGKVHEDFTKIIEKAATEASPASKRIGELAEKLSDLKREQAIAGGELAGKFGMDNLGLVPTGAQTRAMLAQASTAGEAKQIVDYGKRAADIEQAQRGIMQARVSPDDGGFNLQGLGRRMFGGFGMMYIRSIANIMAEPLQAGYTENMAQREMLQKAYGGLTGGYTPGQASPEVMMQNVAALQGGGGWASLKRMEAGALRQSPLLATLKGDAAAAAGAAGLVGTIGMWAGVNAAPYMLPAAAIAGGVAHAAQVAGSIQDQDATAVRLALMYKERQGGLYRNAGDDRTFFGAQNPWENFSKDILGFNMMMSNPGIPGWGEAGRETKNKYLTLTDIQKYRDQGGNDILGYLKEQGVDRADAARYMELYTQYQAGTKEYSSVPLEGLAQANTLVQKYGLNVAEGDQYKQFAFSLAQGVPYEDVARSLATMPWKGLSAQRQDTGRYMSSLVQSGMNEEQAAQLVTGAQRMAGLGVLGEQTIQADRVIVQGREIAGGGSTSTIVPGGQDTAMKLAEMGQGQYDAYRTRMRLAESRAAMGLEYELPDQKKYTEMTTEQLFAEQRALGPALMQQQSLDRIQTGFQRFGVELPDMKKYENLSQIQAAQLESQQQFGFSFGQTMLQGGKSTEFGQAMGMTFSQMNPQQFNMYSGMMQADPMSWAKWAMKNPSSWGQMMVQPPIEGAGNSLVNPLALVAVDIKKVGGEDVMTGMAWGTSSLAMPGVSSEAMAQNVFGDWQGRSDVSQGMIGALIEGGQFGSQMYQLQLQAQHQRDQFGLQWEQFNLQQKYQPQFWAIEDQQRQVSRDYSLWQLNKQEQQAASSDKFWNANAALNRTQQLMQRQWTQQDWGVQDLTRGLQWQWTQEDFQENARFMTGRQRRLGERQMGRQTIMHEIEGEQIDTQRKRQQELWKLEDQRYKLQLQQHQVDVKFQQESIERTRKYYADTWKLQDKQTELNRQYWMEQQELQKKGIELNQAYAEEQQRIAQTMAEFSQYAQELVAGRSLFNPETMAKLAENLLQVDPVFKSIFETGLEDMIKGLSDTNPQLEAFNKLLEQTRIAAGGTSAPSSPGQMLPSNYAPGAPRAHGGITIGGRTYLVGEEGPELFTPGMTGTVTPNSSTNPWANTTLASPVGQKSPQQNVTLVVKIGDETLSRKVIALVDREVSV